MAVLIDIAEAVRAELNDSGGTAFSRDFEAVRAYVPALKVEELKRLHVTVVPKGFTSSTASRASSEERYQVDVAVQQRLERLEALDLDPLMGLVEEIADYFRRRRLSNYPAAICVEIANEPPYSVEHLEELRVFTSVLTLTFTVTR